MKKIKSLLVLFLIFVLSACNTVQNENKEKLSIVTSNFPLYDFAKNICGEKASVSMLIPLESEAHSFEPTPKDIIKLSEADLFIYIGGESDVWIEKIIASANLTPDKILTFNDMIESENGADEHLWTSVRNAEKICERIFEKVSELDSVNSDNYENYINKLKDLDEKFKDITDNSSKNTIVFADRFPFYYFVKDYNLNHYSVFPSCASEAEPSLLEVKNITDIVNKEKIPVVFHIEFSNEKIADTICENTGAKKLMMHSCHNITKEQFENNISYIDLMNENCKNLMEALN